MSARRWLVAAILAVCLGGPIAESFDWWDQSQPAGDDTETNLVVVALSVGLAVSVAAIIVQWFQSFVAGLSSQRLVTARIACERRSVRTPLAVGQLASSPSHLASAAVESPVDGGSAPGSLERAGLTRPCGVAFQGGLSDEQCELSCPHDGSGLCADRSRNTAPRANRAQPGPGEPAVTHGAVCPAGGRTSHHATGRSGADAASHGHQGDGQGPGIGLQAPALEGKSLLGGNRWRPGVGSASGRRQCQRVARQQRLRPQLLQGGRSSG